VKKKTDLSNVMKYGDNSIVSEMVGKFQGSSKASRPALQMEHSAPPTRWPSKDIPLRTVESRLKRATDPVKRQQLERQLTEMKTKRAYHDMHTRALVHKLTLDKPQALREAIMLRNPGKVSNMDCHHETVMAYHKNCFNLGKNPYAMNVATILNNLCDEGIPMDRIVQGIQEHCARKNVHIRNIL